jgi:hypothetical protein
MMKRIRTLGLAVAAVAVPAALLAVSASAQNYPGLAGPPGQPIPEAQAQPLTPQDFRGGDQYRGPDAGDYRSDDWRRGDDWGRDDRGRIDYQRALASCSRAGIERAWGRGFYSAQYEGNPRLIQDRRGAELRGRMRVLDRSGFRTFDTSCELRRNGEADDFDFLR